MLMDMCFGERENIAKEVPAVGLAAAAGDHPDLIVYGEMSWSNHHLGQDGSEDALHRGGSNVWINALPPATTWCNSVTVTGAGDPSWNGVYYRQIDEEHPADGIAFMMDTTHEIYKWGGAWRFAATTQDAQLSIGIGDGAGARLRD